LEPSPILDRDLNSGGLSEAPSPVFRGPLRGPLALAASCSGSPPTGWRLKRQSCSGSPPTGWRLKRQSRSGSPPTGWRLKRQSRSGLKAQAAKPLGLTPHGLKAQAAKPLGLTPNGLKAQAAKPLGLTPNGLRARAASCSNSPQRAAGVGVLERRAFSSPSQQSCWGLDCPPRIRTSIFRFRVWRPTL